MGTHSYQVTTLVLDPLNNLFCRFTVGQLRFCGNTGGLKLCANPFQVCSVFRDFRADRIRTVGPGRPAIGDMQQYHMTVHKPCELLDVFDNRPITRCTVQRHENAVIHRSSVLGVSPLSTGNDLPSSLERIWQAEDVHCGDQNSTGPASGE